MGKYGLRIGKINTISARTIRQQETAQHETSAHDLKNLFQINRVRSFEHRKGY
jgi:hypothetical protein